MNEQIIAALGTLALATLYALIAWVRATQARIEKELERNTTLTKQAEEAATQVAEHTGETIAKLRDRVQTLTGLVDIYRDMVRYVQSTPEGREILDRYRDRRRSIVHDADLDALEKQLLRKFR